eukprot:scaffold83579_cov41-Tisochrysis_lutea.AAC.3
MAGVAVRLPPPVLLEALPSSVAGEVQTRRIHDAAARAQWDLVYKEAVLSQQKSWAALHSGHWASVDVACRTAYAVACFYVATAGVEIARHRTATEELATSQKQADLIDVLKDGLRHADMGLMLGDTTCRRPLLELATRLENALAGLRRDRDEISACTAATHCSETPSAIPSAPCLDSHAIRLLTGSMQPLRLREPSLPYFYNECMEPARPAVLLGAMQDWPAMGSRRWTFNYLIQMAGHRTVPVEIGRHYLSDDFDEKLMNLREFILRFVIRTAAREMQDFDYPGKAVRGCKNTAPFGHMEPQDDGGPRTPCAREFRESPTMADPTLRESPTMADPTRLANAILPANVRGSDEDGRKELREENTASVDPDQGRGSGRGLQKESSPSEWGYLAQHQLFLQIPQLRRDIAVPDYCSLSLEDEDRYATASRHVRSFLVATRRAAPAIARKCAAATARL